MRNVRLFALAFTEPNEIYDFENAERVNNEEAMNHSFCPLRAAPECVTLDRLSRLLREQGGSNASMRAGAKGSRLVKSHADTYTSIILYHTLQTCDISALIMEARK